MCFDCFKKKNEKFGFKEVPEINYKWKVYTPDPFPTMMLSL